MSGSGTEVQETAECSKNIKGHVDRKGQDGVKPSLKGYRIPKRKRESKYDYREESDEDFCDSSDPYEESSEYESDIEREEGELPMSSANQTEYASDEESDVERFDPLYDRSTYVIKGSMARYVQKYFNTYVSDECIKTKVLEDAPVPANEVFSPPHIDDFVEDLVDSYKSMKFLRIHDNSLKFVQKKLAQVMGPLSKVWKEIDGARHGKETSEMAITDMLNLIERIVLLLGQTNVACLYEKRINFMAKILRSMKVAKSTLAKNKDLLTNTGDLLFGEDFYNVLERKSRNRKRARQIAKDMREPKRHRGGDKTPFRSGPPRSNQEKTKTSGEGDNYGSKGSSDQRDSRQAGSFGQRGGSFSNRGKRGQKH